MNEIKDNKIILGDKDKIIKFMYELNYIWSEDAGVFYHKGHYMQIVERSFAEHIYHRVNLKKIKG